MLKAYYNRVICSILRAAEGLSAHDHEGSQCRQRGGLALRSFEKLTARSTKGLSAQGH